MQRICCLCKAASRIPSFIGVVKKEAYLYSLKLSVCMFLLRMNCNIKKTSRKVEAEVYVGYFSDSWIHQPSLMKRILHWCSVFQNACSQLAS